MTGKNKVYVRIAGKDYTLVGVESDEYIQRIAMYIDKKMLEIMKVNSKLSTSMAAVLTAINVADDYVKTHESEFHLKKELKHSLEEIEKIREENRRLINENAALSGKGTNLQLELAKREAELNEVRSSMKNSNRNEM
jgi:cell division protein ZapA